MSPNRLSSSHAVQMMFVQYALNGDRHEFEPRLVLVVARA